MTTTFPNDSAPIPEVPLTPPQLMDYPGRVAAIIPAFNEAETLTVILEVLKQVESIGEIIVVDDGSKDATAAVARQALQGDPRGLVIEHAVNQGKGQAMRTGREAAQSPYLLFMDADLEGLIPAHVEDLIRPVTSGVADMSIGLFKGGRLTTDFAHWATPWMSGQRCLKAVLFDEVSPEATAGYGVETAITVAAQRGKWRRQKVTLRGVTHPSSEFHRGLLAGIRTRAHMYLDVVHAWRVYRRKRSSARPRKPKLRYFLLLVILCMVISASVVYDRTRSTSTLSLDNIAPVSLDGVQSVLIVAPHPDDEALSSGGLIQTALDQGIDVKVIVLTSGDGQMLAPLALQKDFRPHTTDYIAIGQRRQAETLSAMRSLGLLDSDVYFLGYPDRGLMTLWLNNWDASNCLYRASYTHATTTPFSGVFDPNTNYCGKNLLADLKSIIGDYQPDLIVLPHPNDFHLDHQATSNFTRLAVAQLESERPNYYPILWGYVVHFLYYPMARQSLNDPLLPPLALAGKETPWLRLDLTQDQQQEKLAAIKMYKTQMRMMSVYLTNFARPDEIFTPLPVLHIIPIEYSSLGLPHMDPSMIPTFPIQEPTTESSRRFLLKWSDLVGWEVTRLGNVLNLKVDTYGHTIPEVDYRILVKTPSGETTVYTLKNPQVTRASHSISAQLDLSVLGNPPVLGFSAEAYRGGLLDRTSWNFVILQDWIP